MDIDILTKQIEVLQAQRNFVVKNQEMQLLSIDKRIADAQTQLTNLQNVEN